MKILILNGPNLNLLGIREPEIYGKQTYGDLCEKILSYAEKQEIAVEIRQSNHEGDLIDWIQDAYHTFDGIVINPAAYTHTSIAIRDALLAVSLPTVEVHLSDPDVREKFRKTDYITDCCIANVKGKGFDGYLEAMDLLAERNRT